jgi:hypothetical protein
VRRHAPHYPLTRRSSMSSATSLHTLASSQSSCLATGSLACAANSQYFVAWSVSQVIRVLVHVTTSKGGPSPSSQTTQYTYKSAQVWHGGP